MLGSDGQAARDLVALCPPGSDIVCVTSLEEALHRMRTEAFDAVLAPSVDAALWSRARRLVESQRVLDAARAMAAISPEQLLQMTVEQRIDWLRAGIRRSVHDVLHYDLIEMRVLERQSKELIVLLTEGMNAPGADRRLFARDKGNGITGHVATTAKSYLCRDTAVDPLYIQGAVDARSSLTVPLMQGDEVIGTFNVESLQVNAFDEEDVHFVEIFSREIADALGVLELLTAEKRSTAVTAVESISHEVALPVDDILTAGTSLLDRYIGHDDELAEKLRVILAGARSIKQSIQKVGESLTPRGRLPLPNAPEPRPLEGVRVLVVDNDERVRRSAHSILGRWGGIVETARDGEEAVTMARLGHYDAMLADIGLPDLDGYEVFMQLKQAQPQARVILMAGFGYDSGHCIVRARQQGLQHVLYKPFRIDQLRDALLSPKNGVPPTALPGPTLE